MICEPCKIGAYLNSQGDTTKSKKNHKLCEGDCGCQHQTGPGWFVKAGEKPALMRVQSP